MGDNTLSNEAALHALDQFAKMLQIIVDAKQAILSATQADQVRVNLEKTGAVLRTEIAAQVNDKATLLADLQERKQTLEIEIANMAAQAQKDQKAALKMATASLANLQGKINSLEKETQARVAEQQQKLAALQKQIEASEERLGQAQADYSAMKDKFKD